MPAYYEMIIIGAGPAGMSAAIEAAGQGVRVLVLDRQEYPGGQIFRNAGEAGADTLEKLGPDYRRGSGLVEQFRRCGAEFLGGATVWHIAPGRVCYSCEGKSHAAVASQILIATGGMERPVPIEGWTLPGVMGAGAADVLLKSAGLFPEGPVVLCGNGPLILQTAEHLRHLSIPVAGIVLTGGIGGPLRAAPYFPGALLRPLYMARGAAMGCKMYFGNRCFLSSRDIRITEKDGAFSVSFSSSGTRRTLEAAHVLLHEGVVSESRITRMARLRHVWNAKQRYWHAAADEWGVTNQPGIRCAGDVACVRGADAAITLGRLAALDMCRELGKLTLEERNAQARGPLMTLMRLKAMQPFMDNVFAPVPEAMLPADEAVVCRCEELTAGELRAAVLAGNYSPDGLKSQSRAGMGTCQGRMCSAPVAEMIAHIHNIPLERLDPYHAQPPLVPLLFSELAAMELPPEGGQP